jgi:6-phosphogluconolactonase (cycloisomerase 2 family)
MSYESLLVVHTFNQDGTLGDTVCTVRGNFSIEDIVFINADTALIASDQGHDILLLYPFDPHTGQIDSNYLVLQNPEAQLSFPHGMGVSQDGNFLAVCNYGDDKCNLYQLDEEKR